MLFFSCSVRSGCFLRRFFGKLPDDDVEDGGEEDAEEGDAEHAGEDGGAEGLAHFGAGAGGEDEGDDAQDEGEGGHQNGAETETAGFGDGGEAVFAGVFELFGEFDDEDGVLAGESDEDDEADLGEDVVVEAAQIDAADGGEQAHGDDEDDGEGEGPALVLRGEGQEDEEHAQGENEERDIAGDDLLIGEVGPFVAHAAGQVLFGEVLHDGDGLPGTDAGRGIPDDIGGGIQIVALHRGGGGDLGDGAEGGQGNHVSGIAPGLQLQNIAGNEAEFRVGLRVDLEGSAEERNVVHVRGPERDLQGAENIAQRDIE